VTIIDVLIIVLLVLVNGVLAGSEIAVVAVRKTRIQELAEAGSRAARAVQSLRENPEHFLATVQIGITVVGASAGAFGGARFAKDLEPFFRSLPVLSRYAEDIALGFVVSIISYLSLVLGELVPKSLAMRGAERYSLLIGRVLLGLSILARPLVQLLTVSSNAVLSVFGDRTSFTESRLSSEEIQQLVDEAAKAGTVHPHSGEIASRALDFAQLNTADVMVPRNQVVALSRSATPDEIRRTLLEEGHTRIPVFDGDIDNVVGYINVKDVLALAWEQRLIVLADLLRPAYFVPEAKGAAGLLQEMRERRIQIAMVVDEQGGTAGIVTLENLLEELVGEIFSEHDENVPEAIKREADGSFLVAGSVSIRDVNRKLRLDLPEEGPWKSIAGLCLALAGRIPDPGEQVATRHGVILEVVDASPMRIRSIRVCARDTAKGLTS